MDMGMMMVVLLVMMGGMMWVSSRSQKKQEQKTKDMRDSLVVGDEITTKGGIIGLVVSIKDETLVIETSKDRTKIRILRSAVHTIDFKIDAPQD
ncbi:MAG: preprotein translocase subunit YajC [Oscillospiraceae bacterium]|nr:preprotein translocase subunit YajC [Oscillospiraceae bacterium]